MSCARRRQRRRTADAPSYVRVDLIVFVDIGGVEARDVDRLLAVNAKLDRDSGAASARRPRERRPAGVFRARTAGRQRSAAPRAASARPRTRDAREHEVDEQRLDGADNERAQREPLAVDLDLDDVAARHVERRAPPPPPPPPPPPQIAIAYNKNLPQGKRCVAAPRRVCRRALRARARALSLTRQRQS